jgi:PhnB protein
MAINVDLNFNGNCREVVEYYAEIFETERPQIMAMGDLPEDPNYPVSEEQKKLILHAKINICGSYIMMSDNCDGRIFTFGDNISLTIVHDNEEDIKRWFNKLKEDGKVDMELGETFWSKCYGTLTDKFGIMWQLSLDSEHNS